MKINLNKYQANKVGNIISYILSKIEEVGKVSIKRVIKLLFLIDRNSVEISGAPITWLDFKAWK